MMTSLVTGEQVREGSILPSAMLGKWRPSPEEQELPAGQQIAHLGEDGPKRTATRSLIPPRIGFGIREPQ